MSRAWERVAFGLLALAMTVLAWQTTSTQTQLARVQAEVTALQQHPVPVPAQVARSCGAVACIVVPSQEATGLLVVGSRGYGGTSVAFQDYLHSPEGWFRYGSWYVLAKPHWIGGAFCIVLARTDALSSWRMRCLTYATLARMGAPSLPAGASLTP